MINNQIIIRYKLDENIHPPNLLNLFQVRNHRYSYRINCKVNKVLRMN